MNEVIVVSPDTLKGLIQGAVASGVKCAIAQLAKEKTRILDEAGAAEFLAVVPGTLRIWRSRGKGPKYKKIGRMIRYDRADLEAWVKTHGVLTVDSLGNLNEKVSQ